MESQEPYENSEGRRETSKQMQIYQMTMTLVQVWCNCKFPTSSPWGTYLPTYLQLIHAHPKP
jgi:hypothetical protein